MCHPISNNPVRAITEEYRGMTGSVWCHCVAGKVTDDYIVISLRMTVFSKNYGTVKIPTTPSDGITRIYHSTIHHHCPNNVWADKGNEYLLPMKRPTMVCIIICRL